MITPSSPLQACKYLRDRLSIPTSTLGKETLMAAAKTAMSSKIVGADSDFFGRIVVDAVTAVRSEDEATGRWVRTERGERCALCGRGKGELGGWMSGG